MPLLKHHLFFRQQYHNSGTFCGIRHSRYVAAGKIIQGCVCQNTKKCKITGEGYENPEVVLN